MCKVLQLSRWWSYILCGFITRLQAVSTALTNILDFTECYMHGSNIWLFVAHLYRWEIDILDQMGLVRKRIQKKGLDTAFITLTSSVWQYWLGSVTPIMLSSKHVTKMSSHIVCKDLAVLKLCYVHHTQYTNTHTLCFSLSRLFKERKMAKLSRPIQVHKIGFNTNYKFVNQSKPKRRVNQRGENG